MTDDLGASAARGGPARRARGEDDALETEHEAKSISKETTFATVSDGGVLRETLLELSMGGDGGTAGGPQRADRR